MAIVDTVTRLGAALVAMLQTRLELAAVEIEEQSQRFQRNLLLSLLAMFLFGIALVLVALFVVILFWDSYRIAAVLGMAALFALAALALGLKVRASVAGRPRLLAATLAELQKDIEFVKSAGHSHDS
jgi:uncharacterized membrane protein YqjE